MLKRDALRQPPSSSSRAHPKRYGCSSHEQQQAQRQPWQSVDIHRRVQGLADTFILLGLPFDSAQAQQLNKEIFETIYYAGLRTSCQLAQKHGADLTIVRVRSRTPTKPRCPAIPFNDQHADHAANCRNARCTAERDSNMIMFRCSASRSPLACMLFSTCGHDWKALGNEDFPVWQDRMSRTRAAL